MQKIIFMLFCTVLITLCACKDTKSSESSEKTSEAIVAQDTLVKEKASEEPEMVKVYAWVNNLRMREEPNTKSAVVKELNEGEALQFTGNKSDFSQKINLRGKVYDEPWLEVITAEGKTGWAYGGGLKFYKPSIDAKASPYDGCMALLYKNKTEQYQKCVQQVQEKQFKKNKTMVRTTAEGFQVKLLDGTVHPLENRQVSEADSSFTVYQYRYYIPEMGFYVFQKESDTDSISYVLLNDKSGKLTDINAYPKPAPDGKHVICLTSGMENDKNPRVTVYGFTDSGFKEVYTESTGEYYPTAPKWVDGENLEVTLEPIIDDGFFTPKTLRLGLDKGVWTKTK